MCQLCNDLGLNNGPEASTDTPGRVTKNDDGTYTLTLTEREMTNLTLRLAMSVLRERQG